MLQTAAQTPARIAVRAAGPGVIPIGRNDLPLACPRPGQTLWSMHPRVYLPIADEPDGEVMCPYCGARYRLSD